MAEARRSKWARPARRAAVLTTVRIRRSGCRRPASQSIPSSDGAHVRGSRRERFPRRSDDDVALVCRRLDESPFRSLCALRAVGRSAPQGPHRARHDLGIDRGRVEHRPDVFGWYALEHVDEDLQRPNALGSSVRFVARSVTKRLRSESFRDRDPTSARPRGEGLRRLQYEVDRIGASALQRLTVLGSLAGGGAGARVPNAVHAAARSTPADRDEQIAGRAYLDVDRCEAGAAFRLEEDFGVRRERSAAPLNRHEVQSSERPAQREDAVPIPRGEAIVAVDDDAGGRASPELGEALDVVEDVLRSIPRVLPAAEYPAVVPTERDIEEARGAVPRKMPHAFPVGVVRDDLTRR